MGYNNFFIKHGHYTLFIKHNQLSQKDFKTMLRRRKLRVARSISAAQRLGYIAPKKRCSDDKEVASLSAVLLPTIR